MKTFRGWPVKKVDLKIFHAILDHPSVHALMAAVSLCRLRQSAVME